MIAWLLGGALAALAVFTTSRAGDGGPLLTWAGGQYRVTPSDRLWLLRAVESESSQPRDRMWVAQTLINRFVYLKARGVTAYPTLEKFVRAYAQPINPRWASKATAKCKAHPQRCTDAMIARRRIARTRTQFSESTIAAVDSALSGMSIPASSIHYAAPGIGEKGKIKLTSDRRGYNTFYAVSSSKTWPGYSVA